jgi:hypothetical protein
MLDQVGHPRERLPHEGRIVDEFGLGKAPLQALQQIDIPIDECHRRKTAIRHGRDKFSQRTVALGIANDLGHHLLRSLASRLDGSI